MSKLSKDQIGTYLLHNSDTGHTYVGSGVLIKRYSDHQSLLKNNTHYNPKLQNAYNKHPNFDFIAVPTTNREEARDLEQAIINEYHGNPLLLNISIDARYCNSGQPMTDEHKAKISQANKGRKPSPQTIEASVKAHKGIPVKEETKEKLRQANIGRQHTIEARQKMSIASKSAIRTNEWRQNISTSLKGKIPAPQTIEAMILANKTRIRTEEEIQKRSNIQRERMQDSEIKQRSVQALIGRPVSEETRRKISESNKGQICSQETKQKISTANQKPVSINGIQYPNMTAAANDLGISVMTVIRRLNDSNNSNYQRIEKKNADIVT